jgi:hypothetical protein
VQRPKKVPKKVTELPEDVIAHWPEVFKDVRVEAVPIEYLHSVRVSFRGGKIWDIDVEKSREKHSSVDLESVLEQMFKEYDEHIVNVDFRLDTDRIKKDIQARTKSFLKKNK